MSFDVEEITKFAHSAASEKKPKSISKHKFILSIYPEIEKALASGYTQKKYVEGLNSAGMEITLNTFRSCFYRIRNERKLTAQIHEPDNKQTAKKTGGKPSPAILEGEPFNDAETLVGWRIPESIRDWVKVKDGKIIKTLPKSLVLSHEIRDTLKRLKPYE